MRNSPQNILSGQMNPSTLDDQINFFKTQSPPQTNPTKKIKYTNKSDLSIEKICEIYEKQISKIDKKIIKEPIFKNIKKSAETADFAKHLMSPLKNLNPHEELILFYFLQTTISYTVKFCSPEECNLDQLIFLAIILRQDTTKEEYEDSLFDLLIKGDLEKNAGPGLLHINIPYERFSKNKTEDTPEIILKNLIKIAKKYTPYTPKN